MSEEMKQPAPIVPDPAPERGKDTYSYRGWLVSDKFYKRALAVYGHYFVGALMIALPIILLIVVFGVGLGAFLGARSMDATPSRPALKINIDQVCQDSLAYTSFPAGAEAEIAAYLKDCKEGKHPEVIERFKAGLELPSDAAI
jgi:hypothetical protein